MAVPSEKRLRKFIRRWRTRYPLPFVWVDDKANRQYRRSEDHWFAQFEGASQLKRRQVVALIDWTFAHDTAAREQALRGVTGPRESGHAKRCIKKALAVTSVTGALDSLVEERGGIPGWGPTMASVILAACRPDTYIVADHRALRTLRALDLLPPSDSDAFIVTDWWPYLRTCRKLAASAAVSLREVGQALQAAAEDAPKLPTEL